MKKPKYVEELLKIIFFWLGAAFVCSAILSYLGILQPKSNSHIQDPVLLSGLFLMIAFLFAAASFLLGILAANKKRRDSELLANGTRVKGTVEKVNLQRSIQYGSQSPYRIQYAYTFQDRVYHGKSCFLWEKPDLVAGDTILVWTDDSGRSAIQ